jgi:hypothetical protein
LIPAILAMIQGVGTNDECKVTNSTSLTNNSTLQYLNETSFVIGEQVTLNTRFSVSVYFILMFSLLCLSACSFTFLHFSPVTRRWRKKHPILMELDNFDNEVDNENDIQSKNAYDNKGIVYDEIINNPSQTTTITTSMDVNINDNEELTLPHPSISSTRINRFDDMSNEEAFEIKILLIMVFIVTFIFYGIMPGMLSYSTIPYGIQFFHLAVNLSKRHI